VSEELESLEIKINADASGVAPAAKKAQESVEQMANRVNQAMSNVKKKVDEATSATRENAKAQAEAVKATTKGANIDKIAEQADETYANLEAARKEYKKFRDEWSKAIQNSGSKGFADPAVQDAENKMNAAAREVKRLKAEADAISDRLLKASAKAGEPEAYQASREGQVMADGQRVSLPESYHEEAAAKREAAAATSELAAAETSESRAAQTENVGAKGVVARLKEYVAQTKAVKRSSGIFRSIGGYLRSMLVIGAITRMVRSLAQGFTAALRSNSAFAASLASIKGNLLQAFAPIISAALPWINALTNALVQATAALASFVGTLFGLTPAKQKSMAQGLSNIGASASGAGAAAKKAVAAFDELNTLDIGGGGGGGGAGADGIGVTFDDLERNEKMDNLMGNILKYALEIGAAIKLWPLVKAITGASGFMGALKSVAGVVLTIDGLIRGVVNTFRAWTDGVNTENANQMLLATAEIAGGLALVFGTVGAAIGAVVGGIAMFATALKDIINGEVNITTVGTALQGLGLIVAGVSLAFGGLPGIIVGAVTAVVGLIMTNWEAISGFFSNLWETITTWASNAWNAVLSTAKTLITNLKTAWRNFLRVFNATVIKPIKNYFKKAWTAISDAASTAWEAIKGVFTGIGDWFNEHIIQPILNIMPQWLKDALGIGGNELEVKLGVKLDDGETIEDFELINGELVNMKKAIEELPKIELDADVTDAQDAIKTVKDAAADMYGPWPMDIKTDITLTKTGKETLKSISGALKSMSTSFGPAASRFINAVAYANGGMSIPRGDLFIANEAGAELVGTLNGKTAVANQQEIGDAIFKYMDKYSSGNGSNGGGAVTEQGLARAVAQALNGAAVMVGADRLGELAIKSINGYQAHAGAVLLNI